MHESEVSPHALWKMLFSDIGWESSNQSGQQTVNRPQPLRQVGGIIIDSHSDSETD